jgi:hypothetical protein
MEAGSQISQNILKSKIHFIVHHIVKFINIRQGSIFQFSWYPSPGFCFTLQLCYNSRILSKGIILNMAYISLQNGDSDYKGMSDESETSVSAYWYRASALSHL